MHFTLINIHVSLFLRIFLVFWLKFWKLTRCRPLKGTTMHPRCRHIGACWDLLEWFQLFSTSQNKSQIQFRIFLKKKSNFLVPMLYYSWRPFRWRINYLCRTDIDEARAIFSLGIRKLGVRTEFNFELFEKFSHFWVSMV